MRLFWVGLLCFVMSGIATGKAPVLLEKDPDVFRIGIIRKNSETGRRFKKGIEDALAQKEISDTMTLVADVSYNLEKEGVEKLVELAESGEVDIILGPTESGVYVRAFQEERDRIVKSKVPVISSQVTTHVKHEIGSWFFRTNVNIERRAESMFYFLNKHWITSMTVVFADTTFAMNAENAFRGALEDTRRLMALPISYEAYHFDNNNVPKDFGTAILEILEKRPEAIGIFSEREKIGPFIRCLKERDWKAQAYNPIFFSVLDGRVIDLENEDFYFTSVTKSSNRERDDVYSLAYDTTMLAGRIIRVLPDVPSGKPSAEQFRNHFEAVLSDMAPTPVLEEKGSEAPSSATEAADKTSPQKIDTALDLAFKIKAHTASMTGIGFTKHENNTELWIYKWERDIPEHQDKTVSTGFFARLMKKVVLLHSRHGFATWLNFLLLLSVVSFVSTRDIRKQWGGKVPFLLISWHYWVFLAFNMTVTLGLFIWLGESGAIQYDTVSTTLIMAVTPMAVIRTTIFETRAGTAIGLGEMYDQFVEWVFENIAQKRKVASRKIVNIVAFSNTYNQMERELESHWRQLKGAEQKRIKHRFETSVDKEIRWHEKRKVAARHLTYYMSWNQLCRGKLVRAEWRKKKNLLMIDPEEVVKETARIISGESELATALDNAINGAWLKKSEGHRETLKDTYAEYMDDNLSNEERVESKIYILFLLTQYTTEIIGKIRELDAEFKKNQSADKNGEEVDESELLTETPSPDEEESSETEDTLETPTSETDEATELALDDATVEDSDLDDGNALPEDSVLEDESEAANADSDALLYETAEEYDSPTDTEPDEMEDNIAPIDEENGEGGEESR